MVAREVYREVGGGGEVGGGMQSDSRALRWPDAHTGTESVPVPIDLTRVAPRKKRRAKPREAPGKSVRREKEEIASHVR